MFRDRPIITAFLAALVLLIAGLGCFAQIPVTGAGKGVIGGAASFTGPGDAVSGAVVYWSCSRAITSAYAAGGGNACDIQRTSDNATCTTKFATNGFLDVTTAYCSSNTQTITQFCNATTCGASKMYDQTGSNNCNSGTNPCDVVQTTQASQPTLNLSCLNSKPCLQFVQANSLFLQSATLFGTLGRPYTIV